MIGRPSASSYDPFAASGSNWAASNPSLRERVAASPREVAVREGVTPTAIPPELIAASGSGIDPDLTVEAARIQLPRIARVRGIPLGTLEGLLAAQTKASDPRGSTCSPTTSPSPRCGDRGPPQPLTL